MVNGVSKLDMLWETEGALVWILELGSEFGGAGVLEGTRSGRGERERPNQEPRN
jgi:hypothetical protein